MGNPATAPDVSPTFPFSGPGGAAGQRLRRTLPHDAHQALGLRDETRCDPSACCRRDRRDRRGRHGRCWCLWLPPWPPESWWWWWSSSSSTHRFPSRWCTPCGSWCFVGCLGGHLQSPPAWCWCSCGSASRPPQDGGASAVSLGPEGARDGVAWRCTVTTPTSVEITSMC